MALHSCITVPGVQYAAIALHPAALLSSCVQTCKAMRQHDTPWHCIWSPHAVNMTVFLAAGHAGTAKGLHTASPAFQGL
jgi:hypothetical protein